MGANSFIKANANKDYICGQFTEVLRDLIRAISAHSDYSGGLYRSTNQMQYVMKLLKECEDPISWRDLFLNAIEELRPHIDYKEYDAPAISAAMSGMSYLAEVTCLDNAARGRASKKQHNFIREASALCACNKNRKG